MRRLITTATVALCAALPAAAWAHGPAPAAIEVVGPSGPRAELVRTTIGLAAVIGDGPRYEYICPDRWEALHRIPPVAVWGDGRLALVNHGLLWVSDARACRFETSPLPDWQGTFVAQAGPDHEGWLWIASRTRDGVRLWRAHADGRREEVTLALPFDLDDLAMDPEGRVWGAGARPSPGVVRLDGEPCPVTPVEIDEELQFVRLRDLARAPETLPSLVGAVDEGVALLEHDGDAWQVTARAEFSIHGPAPHGDRALLVADGALHTRALDQEAWRVGPHVGWTCLHPDPGGAIACVNRDLHRVTGDTDGPAPPDTAPIFTLEQLDGPSAACAADDAAEVRCRGQWIHFAAEAGLYVAPDAGPPDAGSSDAGTPDAEAEKHPDGGGDGPGGDRALDRGTANPLDASADPGDAAASDARAPDAAPPTASATSGGCALAAPGGSGAATILLGFLALGACRRRQSRHRHGGPSAGG